MGTMAKEGLLRAAIEETKYLIEKPRIEVREEKMRGLEFPEHNKLMAAIQRHQAMLRDNQTSACLPFQNGTPKNPHTSWGRTETGALPPA
jgi:hypothetical protein